MATKKKATVKKTTSKKKAAAKTTQKATPKKASVKGKTTRPNRVFAIRVSDAELAAIHRASGPRNATRFIRAVAAAFANADESAFRAVVKEARAVKV